MVTKHSPADEDTSHGGKAGCYSGTCQHQEGKEEEEENHSSLETVERGKNHSPAMLEEILGIMLTPGWSLTVVEDDPAMPAALLRSLAG